MDFSAQSNISFIKQKIDDLEKITDQDNPYTRIVFSKIGRASCRERV